MAAILLVEDVDIVRSVLRRFLESVGHEVTECASGDEAGRIAGRAKFDLVITDLWMKNGNGVDFIRAQSAYGRALPTIAMTSGDPNVTRSESVEAALRAGAQRVLIKPVTKKYLLQAVDSVLGQNVGSAENAA
jgi:CheY-like chemotaxis protein